MAAVAGGAAGDHEGAEAGDGDGLALAQRLAHAADERGEGAIGGGAGAAGGLRENRHELGLGHADVTLRPGQYHEAAAAIRRHTASSNAIGENGFSTTGTSAPSVKARGRPPAAWPGMKMKRRRDAGSGARAGSENSWPPPPGMRMSET